MAEAMALLVIDMQKELLRRPVWQKQVLLDNVNHLISHFHDKKTPVFFIRHCNDSFLKEGSDGWQLDAGLCRADTDILVDKTHSSVFKEKAFVPLLQEAEVATLVVTGLVTNGCVQAACVDALKRGYSVILVDGSHSTFHKEASKVIAEWNEKLGRLGVRMMAVNEVLGLVQ